jgi:two-component system response regulator
MTDKSILLVEDNADDVELTLRAFQANHIHNHIHVARDGVEAIEMLFGSEPAGAPPPELPALVLLDLKLPKIGGLEVLRRIRGDERTRRLPVVMLTSSNEQEDLLSSYGLGANSYVRKPVDFSEFLAATLQVGLYWLVRNVPPPVA